MNRFFSLKIDNLKMLGGSIEAAIEAKEDSGET